MNPGSIRPVITTMAGYFIGTITVALPVLIVLLL
jgi:hypothetical protein